MAVAGRTQRWESLSSGSRGAARFSSTLAVCLRRAKEEAAAAGRALKRSEMCYGTRATRAARFRPEQRVMALCLVRARLPDPLLRRAQGGSASARLWATSCSLAKEAATALMR